MDKALEIIMVAVILMVASVVVIALLQSQTDSFGGFADGQTNSSDCGLSELQYERSLNCPSEGSAAENVRNDAYDNGCTWAESSDQSSDYC